MTSDLKIRIQCDFSFLKKLFVHVIKRPLAWQHKTRQCVILQRYFTHHILAMYICHIAPVKVKVVREFPIRQMSHINLPPNIIIKIWLTFFQLFFWYAFFMAFIWHFIFGYICSINVLWTLSMWQLSELIRFPLNNQPTYTFPKKFNGSLGIYCTDYIIIKITKKPIRRNQWMSPSPAASCGSRESRCNADRRPTSRLPGCHNTAL